MPLQTTNLVGLHLDPRVLDDAPPEIRLPPNVRGESILELSLFTLELFNAYLTMFLSTTQIGILQ